MKEYVVYVDNLEVLLQVLNNVIIGTGPDLRKWLGKPFKKFYQESRLNNWKVQLIVCPKE